MIRVSHLNKTYDRGRRTANQVLHDLSFDLPETGFVCILGASGCGKTSLLNAIGGLDAFDSGTLSAGEVVVTRYGTQAYETERNRNFGYIFQNYYLLQDHSAGYNVYLGLHSLDLSHTEKLRRVREALRAVDMERYIRRTVGELSGGQQQRVAIARALARQPRVIFADEPTGNLDEANTVNICSLLRKISKTSLVVMVTHEKRIARFFADRIITLSDGRIVSDCSDWQRDSLSVGTGNTLYAGDYHETGLEAEGVTLRLLWEEGAAPVQASLLVLKDRIVLKLDDSRGVCCGGTQEPPVLQEGRWPVLTLESLDQDCTEPPVHADNRQASPARAGQGIRFSIMFKEALRLMRGEGLRRVGMRVFLVLLTALTVLTVGDYITVASVDPEDFITTHSQMLEIKLEQGPVIRGDGAGVVGSAFEFGDYLRESGLEFDLVPHVPVTATYTVRLFPQMSDSLSIKLMNLSYVPLSHLDESTLIYGRMPENAQEIVVDRWVLDSSLKSDGILQNGLSTAASFLGSKLSYSKKNYAPEIVGICDSGNPAIYIDETGLISLGVGGKEVMRLSELKQMHPEYADVTLWEKECLVVTNNAGSIYESRIGGTYSTSVRTSYTITDAIRVDDTYASIVVDDSQIQPMLDDMITTRFHIYCEDKQAMLRLLRSSASSVEEAGYIVVEVTDSYTQQMNAYTKAAHLRADARTIVTVTVLVLALVMLYLLCRAQAQERIGMLAVYRLLGIPGRKVVWIFSMETVLSSLCTAFPTAFIVWGVVSVLNAVPDLNFSLILPWQAVLGACLVILMYHLLVSLLPLRRLLCIPPAQLAAKYDL